MTQKIINHGSPLLSLNVVLIIFFPISLLIGSLISNIFLILISILFVIDQKGKNLAFIKNDYNFYYLIIIYFYLVFNAIFLSENEDSILRAVGFIRFIIFAYALAFYFQFYKSKIIKYWTIIFLIVTADILIEYIFGKNSLGFSAEDERRIASFTGNELKIGGFYFGLIFICLSFFKNKNEKVFYVFLLLFLGISLLIGERSNFLKVLIMTLTYLIFFTKFDLLKKIILFLSVLIFSITIIFFSPQLKARFSGEDFFGFFKSQDNLIFNHDKESLVKNNRHFSHYNTAINIFRDNVIFGSGIKTFRYESYKEEYNDIEGITGASTHPHQLHFELLSELGLIGYLLIISNLIIILFNQQNLKTDFLRIAAYLFLVSTLFPILPSGSFFTSYTASFFWLNYSFLLRLNNYDKLKLQRLDK